MIIVMEAKKKLWLMLMQSGKLLGSPKNKPITACMNLPVLCSGHCLERAEVVNTAADQIVPALPILETVTMIMIVWVS